MIVHNNDFTLKPLFVNVPCCVNLRFFKGKTAYSATKVGMTVLVHGLAMELKGTGKRPKIPPSDPETTCTTYYFFGYFRKGSLVLY